MRQINILLAITILRVLSPFFSICPAQEPSSFQGKINADNINVRSDSTVSAEIICKVNRGDPLEVVLELYGWYKIRLPKNAPSFIKKDLVIPLDEKNAAVTKDNVNIRLRADESSPIIGKAKKGDLLNVVRDNQDWLKIEPIDNSFGWVHKKFVDRAPDVNKVKRLQLAGRTEEDKGQLSQEDLTVEGMLNPKVIKRIASHKLIAQENKLFLVRGDKEKLNSFNYRKVKISGKLIASDNKQKLPIIEVNEIEALD